MAAMRLPAWLLPALLLPLATGCPADDGDDGDDDDTTHDPMAAVPVCAGSVTGDLHIDGIDPPLSDSEDYEIPTSSELEGLRSSIEALLDGDGDAAMEGASLAGYRLCRGDGDEAERVLWRPEADGSGGAWIVVDLGPARPLILGTPHAWLEYGVLDECLAAFEQIGARALIVTGTHRCANATPSGCSGTTMVCLAGDEDYRESDMAHVVDGHYQVAHEALADHFTTDWVISVHGFPYSGISVSNGTYEDADAGTPVALFTQALMHAYPGEYVTSCNDWPGSVVDRRYCGTTNTQGRYVNGAGEPCTQAAASSVERFMHLEQHLSIWPEPQPVIDALDSVVPAAE
jgi:hypothetical protein